MNEDTEGALWIIGITLGFILFLGLLFYAVFISYNCSRYEMPNGVICEVSENGRDAHEFRYCSDGKEYINPEYFKYKDICEVKK